MPVTRSSRLSLQAPFCIFIVLAMIALGASGAAFAQQPKAQTGTTSASQASSDTSGIPGTGLYSLLQKKSLFFPEIATSTQRLSTGGKFKLFVDKSISLSTISWSALTSAISQAENSPSGFGQGWDAYGKRFGSSMARTASSEFFGTFMLASALHQDPRFYPETNPGFLHAVKYSAQRVFVTRNDDGKDVANWSGLGGPLMGESLANVYWPDRNRTVGDTFLRYGLDLATKAGGNMFREYWPVLYGKIHHTPKADAVHN